MFMFVSSRNMNQTNMSMRGFALPIVRLAHVGRLSANDTPNNRSGGVCQPYSVTQIRFLPQSLFTTAMSELMFPIVTDRARLRVDGVSLGLSSTDGAHTHRDFAGRRRASDA